ncbi:MAG: TIGR03905 family TSCPD domain-containing protein [Clostridia bacterium]|nr:TIGR03905 family TSCPD domain-containing protein [Clostridia bacterium]
MEYRYKTKGTCSQEMIIEVEQNIIKKVTIIGGCAGNTKGISKLVEGMTIDEVIEKLKGTPCKDRGTSCPDQLAKALEQIKAERKIHK